MKKTVCEEIVSKLCTEFLSFVSASARPLHTNFNRDILIDWVATWSIDFSKSDITDLVFSELLKLNDVARMYVVENNITCPKKCMDKCFYLFYLKKHVIQHHIEKELTPNI